MAAAAAAASETPSGAFISRSIAGYGMLHMLKGVAWGNVVALSQAVGTWRECGGVGWRWVGGRVGACGRRGGRVVVMEREGRREGE